MRRRTDGLEPLHDARDRLLPALVAAMVFLAGLAVAGATGATLLADRWRVGAVTVVTIQVPASPSGGGAADAVAAILHADAGLARVERLDRIRLSTLLAPWIGQSEPALGNTDLIPLPTVFQLRLFPNGHFSPALGDKLRAAAPGTTIEATGAWSVRLLALARSLQFCAITALLVVAVVATGVVAAMIRASLGDRRIAIEILHELGASDGFIAGRFARRASGLAFGGGIAGTVLVMPLLLVLCQLTVPFSTAGTGSDPAPIVPRTVEAAAARVPVALRVGLPLLPITAAVISWGTAQLTVRTWLRRLP